MFERISSNPYLSGYTYRTLASQAIPDVGDTKYMHDVSDGIVAEKVQENDLLYVTGNRVKDFFQTMALDIEVPFRMITAQTDPGVDSLLANMMPDNVTKWYSINVHVDDSRIESIPLGLQNLNWRWDGNIQSGPSTYTQFKDREKSKEILASFSIDNNPLERTGCVKAAKKINADFRMFQRQDRQNESYVLDYFDQVSQYKFVLCPWGCGVDTHRLWESLYLGSIPITRRHKVYEDFLDYPILFVDKWSELLTLDLEKEYNRLNKKLEQDNRIYFPYWEKKING
jgi:hypothetical protein